MEFRKHDLLLTMRKRNENGQAAQDCLLPCWEAVVLAQWRRIRSSGGLSQSLFPRKLRSLLENMASFAHLHFLIWKSLSRHPGVQSSVVVYPHPFQKGFLVVGGGVG